jgi:hypothetical protein
MAAPGSTSPSLDASLIALNLQHRGTLPRSKPYRLEVSTPETSPNWTPALHGFREAGFPCIAIDGTRQLWTSVNSHCRIKTANVVARRACRRPNRVQPAVTIRALFVLSADWCNRATKRTQQPPPSQRRGNHVHRLMTARSLRTGVGKVRIETGSGEGRSGLPV